MYAGLVPIDSSNTSRALFSIFQPKIGAPVDEVTIWLNGGPGCSSLEGFFQENGRFLWQPGTYLPTENPYSYVNLTNVLWVDQPGKCPCNLTVVPSFNDSRSWYWIFDWSGNGNLTGGDRSRLHQILQELAKDLWHQEFQDIRYRRVLRWTLRSLHLSRHD